jgi:diaminopimelate epimerase
VLPAAGVPFVKGHGTENDFLVIPDLTGSLDLPMDVVMRICDRRAGVGADGVLRVVPAALTPEVASLAGEAEWFMDYRNADGSLAEMCGNGVRVYARYLLSAGLVRPGPLRLVTRHGIREVLIDPAGDSVTVDMGTATIGSPVSITVAGERHRAIPVDLGNPHAVVVLDEPVTDLDLSVPPVVPVASFPMGVNVEVVNVLAPGRLRMRVIERGVGETRSCGTGACAAAVAAGPGGDWTVQVPGGRLAVSWSGDRILLRGPAVLVADGTLRPGWLCPAADGSASAAPAAVDAG